MILLSKQSNRSAFTLIEVLIVVVILGVVASIVVPQFTDASDLANDAAVRTQLQTLRGQIDLYRANEGETPDFASVGWTSMVDNDYLSVAPKNPITGTSEIDIDTIDSGGWLWKKKSNGTYVLYAVDGESEIFIE